MSEQEKFDTVGFMMAFEAGELNEEQVVAGFQQLINSGIVWKLQGSYGRAARFMIERGMCHE